jgi:hypothetical protein
MIPRIKKGNSFFIGHDAGTNEKLYLSLRWLNEKNLHVIGPPGEGKTRELLWLFECLCRVPRATVVLMNPKGGLARMARDYVLGHGLTKRLVWFDPGDSDTAISYNPLWPNGLAVAAHAKAVRESIRSAWGQANLDQTPQLARLLYLSLGVCRALELTIADAVQLLRSGAAGAPLRRKLLPHLAANRTHHFFHEALTWFDSLSERRQDELGASTLARLEAFISDPAIASMLTAPRSLDMASIISDHKILLVNLEIKRPLALDDVRLLGRMIVNDIVSHVFARPAEERGPVYFFLDEAHQFLTEDLAQALDMGRELGLHVIVSHQNLDQLRQEDQNGRIYGSVMKCARVKMIFGDCAADDLDTLLRDAMIDGFDPLKIKDELTSLELSPVESSRLVVSFGITKGSASGTTQTTARGRSRSTFESQGTTVGTGSAISSGHATGTFTGVSAGEIMLANGDMTFGTHETSGTTSGESLSESFMNTENYSNASGVQDGVSQSESTGTNSLVTTGMTMNVTKTPFYEYERRRNVSSRTFETEQEYLTKCLQRAKAQPVGHFLLKLPKRPARFVRAPFVPDPRITERRKVANLARVYEQPCYRDRATDNEPIPTAPYQIENPEVDFVDVRIPSSRFKQQPLEFSEAPPPSFLEEK